MKMMDQNDKFSLQICILSGKLVKYVVKINAQVQFNRQ